VKYRRLGYTGLRVSELALGTMNFGGQDKVAFVGATEVEEARRNVDVAIDGGINLIDTGDVYFAGRSEEILGEVLEGRRDEIVLATKARFAIGKTGNGC
jgi:aryl-alcohol dehydrogenase-like predicted oxidoreductase